MLASRAWCSEPGGSSKGSIAPGMAQRGDIMKRLLIGAGLCALLAAPAWAGEPAKLSLAQMDRVTAAGDFCYGCANYNATYQANYVAAYGGANYAYFAKKSGNAIAVGVNVNKTEQEIN
jgi:hypothetical protein